MINLGEYYELEGYDPSYEVIFHASWSDYEESGWVAIMRHPTNGLFIQQGGYSVMCEDNTDCWNPWPISEEAAFETMLEWEENEN